jgi:Bacterial nucleoid DNA-binding protein
MSTDKISIQEIADELSAKLNITKRAAEDFVKMLFGTIEEALLSGDSVKIKDLGAFKLQSLEPRKSVNIQTGEEIIIPGYMKINFTPEASLKELVNEPFAHLESVVLDNVEFDKTPDRNLRHFTEQATEIKGIMSDIEALSHNEKEPEEETETEIIYQPLSETKKIEEEEKLSPYKDNIEQENTDEDFSEEYFFYEKKRRGWVWVLLILLAVLIGIGTYIFLACPETAEKLKFWEKETPIEQVDEAKNATETTTDDTVTPEFDEFLVLFDTPRVYTEYLTTVRLPAGGNLAYLAKLHYGHAYFWVYIYEANKNNIKHPNFIPIGQLIRVPKVDPLLIDVCNPRCLEKAQELEQIYLKK